MAILMPMLVMVGAVAAIIAVMLLRESLGKPRAMDSLTKQEREIKEQAYAGVKHRDDVLVVNLNDYPHQAGFELQTNHIGQGLVKSFLEPLRKRLFDQRAFSFHEAVDPKLIYECELSDNSGGGEPMRMKLIMPVDEIKGFPILAPYIKENSELKHRVAILEKEKMELEAARELPQKVPHVHSLFEKAIDLQNRGKQLNQQDNRISLDAGRQQREREDERK